MAPHQEGHQCCEVVHRIDLCVSTETRGMVKSQTKKNNKKDQKLVAQRKEIENNHIDILLPGAVSSREMVLEIASMVQQQEQTIAIKPDNT